MSTASIRFETTDQGRVDLAPPSGFALKRAGTASTKESYSTHGSYSTAYSYFTFPSYERHEAQNDASTISCDNSSLTTRHSIGDTEKTNSAEFVADPSERSIAEESLPSTYSTVENGNDDQIIETKTKNRSLSLVWDRGSTIASSSKTANNTDNTDEFQLHPGISKSDIMVTIDVDDEARSSRVEELDEDNLDVEILHHKRRNSGDSSPRKQCHRQRREFEETVRQGILDDLTSVYTATPKTAKLVLCVVVSVLSDGTLDHTFWSGGRVGLTEVALQWLLFDADDLQVYKRGRAVQKKDFGFGPLGLTETEGQHYLATKLAPRAANDIMRKVGNGVHQDLLVEF